MQLVYKRGPLLSTDADGRPYPDFFSVTKCSVIGRTEEEYLRQFDGYKGPIDSERLHEACDGALDIAGVPKDLAASTVAMAYHLFCLPPVFSLEGLDYWPLDPGCPELCADSIDGQNLAADLMDEENPAIDHSLFAFIDTAPLARFVPRYVVPWHDHEVLYWPSHWAALLRHLYDNPLPLSAFAESDI